MRFFVLLLQSGVLVLVLTIFFSVRICDEWSLYKRDGRGKNGFVGENCVGFGGLGQVLQGRVGGRFHFYPSACERIFRQEERSKADNEIYDYIYKFIYLFIYVYWSIGWFDSVNWAEEPVTCRFSVIGLV